MIHSDWRLFNEKVGSLQFKKQLCINYMFRHPIRFRLGSVYCGWQNLGGFDTLDDGLSALFVVGRTAVHA